MLTNDQALAIIKQHDECFVVWATDRNMIVGVYPIPKDATVDERISALGQMSKDYSGPTKGRYVSSATTTLQTLIDESKETERIAGRIAIFNSWRKCSVDQLIDIVVNAAFAEPMDVMHGTCFIVERLYKIYGPVISSGQIHRLSSFAESILVDREQQTGLEMLQCYLCVLTRDSDKLKYLYRKHHSPEITWSSWSAFVDSVGDLPTDDGEIIEELISIVEKFPMFGPRFEAMIGLGKIGGGSGERAANVIVDMIYDSSEKVSTVRDRVVSRIRSRSSDWSTCSSCYHGYVEVQSGQISRIQSCEACLGMGCVPNGS